MILLQLTKSDKPVINANDSQSNETTNATENTTLITEVSAKSSEVIDDTITSTPMPFTSSENPTNNNTESAEIESVSTQVPATSITNSTEPNTLLRNLKIKKKGKVAEEHHYMGSIKIIMIIVGALLSVLVVSAVALRIYENRRKNMHARTSSTTYVFETNN